MPAPTRTSGINKSQRLSRVLRGIIRLPRMLPLPPNSSAHAHADNGDRNGKRGVYTCTKLKSRWGSRPSYRCSETSSQRCETEDYWW